MITNKNWQLQQLSDDYRHSSMVLYTAKLFMPIREVLFICWYPAHYGSPYHLIQRCKKKLVHQILHSTFTQTLVRILQCTIVIYCYCTKSACGSNEDWIKQLTESINEFLMGCFILRLIPRMTVTLLSAQGYTLHDASFMRQSRRSFLNA